MEKLGSGKFQLLTILTIFTLILTACSSNESSNSNAPLTTLDSGAYEPSTPLKLDPFAPETALETVEMLFDPSNYLQSGDRENSCFFISALRDLLAEMDAEPMNPKSGISRDQFLKYTEDFNRIIAREGENREFIRAFYELNLIFNKFEAKWYLELKFSEFEKTWCEKPWGKPKLPVSTTGNDVGLPKSKPRFVEKCRLETPEGGMYDKDGYVLPFDRVCEMVPVG